MCYPKIYIELLKSHFWKLSFVRVATSNFTLGTTRCVHISISLQQNSLVQGCNFDIFHTMQCTSISLQDLGSYGPWSSYATGIIMYACKLSQCCEDIPVYFNKTSVIFLVKVPSETIFEHLICTIFLGKGVELALLVS